MSSVDPVMADPVGPMTFHGSRRRAFLMMFGLAGALWFLVQVVCMLLVGSVGMRPAPGDLAVLLAGAGGYAALVAAAYLLVTGRRPTSVQVSASGLAVTADGRGAVALPWSQIRAVSLHRAGPWARLVVTPAPDPQVGSGIAAPIVVDVAGLAPSPERMLDAIRHATGLRS